MKGSVMTPNLRIELREETDDPDSGESFKKGSCGVIEDIDTFEYQETWFYVTMEDGRETVLYGSEFRIVRD